MSNILDKPLESVFGYITVLRTSPLPHLSFRFRDSGREDERKLTIRDDGQLVRSLRIGTLLCRMIRGVKDR